MELNTSGLNKKYSEMNPGEGMFMMSELNIPIVMSSDYIPPNGLARILTRDYDY